MSDSVIGTVKRQGLPATYFGQTVDNVVGFRTPYQGRSRAMAETRPFLEIERDDE